MNKERACKKEKNCYIAFIRFNASVDEEIRQNLLQKFYTDNVDLLDTAEYNETRTEKIFVHEHKAFHERMTNES